jgi:hypothetical protein
VGPPDRLPVAVAALQSDDLDGRVAVEQANQLGADIPGRTDDPDPDPRPGGRRPIDVRASGRLDPCAPGRSVAARGDGSFTEDGLEGLTA